MTTAPTTAHKKSRAEFVPSGRSSPTAFGGRDQRPSAADPVDTGTALAAFVAGGLLLLATAAVLGDDAASATQQITGAVTVV